VVLDAFGHRVIQLRALLTGQVTAQVSCQSNRVVYYQFVVRSGSVSAERRPSGRPRQNPAVLLRSRVGETST
jgi:hypothetical protein